MSNGKVTDGGVSFLGLLAIVFIVLKLTDFISWSWWWVLAPLWGPAAITIIVLIIIFILAMCEKK